MSRRKMIAIDDCKGCMENRTELERRFSGCGYLPPAEDRTRLTIWQPPLHNGKCGYTGPALTTCAGYTANLPEVIETAVARMHWKNGAIVPACDGEMPTEDLLNSILIVDSAYSELEGWMMTPSKDGGGGA